MRHQQSKKKTAWKKTRTFGDIKGGRMRLKLYAIALYPFPKITKSL